MSKLARETVIGSKVASVVVTQVTVRADGTVFADWAGLDAGGQGVLRQVAAFAAKDAESFLAGKAADLVVALEVAVVRAITISGSPPPKEPAPPVPTNSEPVTLAKALKAGQPAAGT